MTLLATAAIGAAQPEATWLERKYDMGIFHEQDGKVSGQMHVVNTGNEPLIIVKAQAGCGCTVVNYPETPIQPGDTAAIGITYNPAERPGQFTKQVLVFTNTTPKRTVLEITGNVIPTSATLDKEYPLQAGSLRISQQSLPLGELVRGKNTTKYLSTYNASTDTLIVTVSGGKDHIRPAIVPDTVPPAKVSALTVHYLSGKTPLWGLNTDTLTLSCKPLHQPSTATAGTADVLVMAQVIESFDNLTENGRQNAPVVSIDCGDRLDFESLGAATQVTRTFTITNKGKNPLIIRRLWVPEGEGITAKADKQELKRGKKATVTVTVDTAHQQGNMLNVPLTVITNDPENPRATVRLVGIIDKK